MPNRDGRGPRGHGMGRRQQQRAVQPAGAGWKQKPGNKIAITDEKQDLNSVMDMCFGRANYFLIYNPDMAESRFIDNPGKDATDGAGPLAAEILANEGVGKIFSGDFGPKASDALNSMNIEMVTLQDNQETLQALIDKIKS